MSNCENGIQHIINDPTQTLWNIADQYGLSVNDVFEAARFNLSEYLIENESNIDWSYFSADARGQMLCLPNTVTELNTVWYDLEIIAKVELPETQASQSATQVSWSLTDPEQREKYDLIQAMSISIYESNNILPNYFTLLFNGTYLNSAFEGDRNETIEQIKHLLSVHFARQYGSIEAVPFDSIAMEWEQYVNSVNESLNGHLEETPFPAAIPPRIHEINEIWFALTNDVISEHQLLANEAAEIINLLEILVTEIVQAEYLSNNINIKEVNQLSDYLLDIYQNLEDIIVGENVTNWLRSSDGGDYFPKRFFGDGQYNIMGILVNTPYSGGEYAGATGGELFDFFIRDIIDDINNILSVETIPIDEEIQYTVENLRNFDTRNDDINGLNISSLDLIHSYSDILKRRIKLLDRRLHALEIREEGEFSSIEELIILNHQMIEISQEMENITEIQERLAGFYIAVEEDRILYILDEWDEEKERGEINELQGKLSRIKDFLGNQENFLSIPVNHIIESFQAYLDSVRARFDLLLVLKNERNRIENISVQAERDVMIGLLAQHIGELNNIYTSGNIAIVIPFSELSNDALYQLIVDNGLFPHYAAAYLGAHTYTFEEIFLNVALFAASFIDIIDMAMGVIDLLTEGDPTSLMLSLIPFDALFEPAIDGMRRISTNVRNLSGNVVDFIRSRTNLADDVAGLADDATDFYRHIPSSTSEPWDVTVRRFDQATDNLEYLRTRDYLPTDELGSKAPAVPPSSRNITLYTDRELLNLLEEEIPHHYNTRFGYGEMDGQDKGVAGIFDDRPEGFVLRTQWTTTPYALAHETRHLTHLNLIGEDAYRALNDPIRIKNVDVDAGKFVKEIFVYQRLANPEGVYLYPGGLHVVLSSAERTHSRNLLIHYRDAFKITKDNIDDVLRYLSDLQQKLVVSFGVSLDTIQEILDWERSDL